MSNERSLLRDFYTSIWKKSTGWVYLPIKTSGGEWKKKCFKWPEHREHIIEFTLAQAAANSDVYFAPSLFTLPKPTKDHFKESNVVWADLDGAGKLDWEVPESKGVPGPPSRRVQSSSIGHQHLYWDLPEPCTDLQKLESINRAVAYSIDSMDKSGWDINQVLRPPVTTNHRRQPGKKGGPTPVILLDSSETSYPLSSWKFDPVKQLIKDSIIEEDMPPFDKVLATYTWSEDDAELIAKTKEEVPALDRSSALMRIAYSCAEKGMSDTEAYVILYELDETWGKYSGRADQKKRLLDILGRARQKHPRKVEEKLFAGLRSPNVKIETKIQPIDIAFGDFLEEQDEDFTWLINEVADQTGLIVVAAEPGVGKTQLTTYMAICAATGTKYLDWDVPEPHKITYMSLEMGRAKYRKLLSNMAPGMTPGQLKLLQENFWALPRGYFLPLDTKEGRAFFEDYIQTRKPSGIYIDSLQKILSKGMKDSEEILAVTNYLQQIRQTYGCYITIVHHAKKPATGERKRIKDMNDLYGSVYIAAEADHVIILGKTDTRGELVYGVVKSRMVEEPDPFIIKRSPTLQFSKCTPTIPVKESVEDRLRQNPPTEGSPTFKFNL
jgi:hypothetical protein